MGYDVERTGHAPSMLMIVGPLEDAKAPERRTVRGFGIVVEIGGLRGGAVRPVYVPRGAALGANEEAAGSAAAARNVAADGIAISTGSDGGLDGYVRERRPARNQERRREASDAS